MQYEYYLTILPCHDYRASRWIFRHELHFRFGHLDFVYRVLTQVRGGCSCRRPCERVVVPCFFFSLLILPSQMSRMNDQAIPSCNGHLYYYLNVLTVPRSLRHPCSFFSAFYTFFCEQCVLGFMRYFLRIYFNFERMIASVDLHRSDRNIVENNLYSRSRK